jgi:hypothetical protein
MPNSGTRHIDWNLSGGITLRDYFAGIAMEIADRWEGDTEVDFDLIARWSYKLADAMLEARKK